MPSSTHTSGSESRGEERRHSQEWSLGEDLHTSVTKEARKITFLQKRKGISKKSQELACVCVCVCLCKCMFTRERLCWTQQASCFWFGIINAACRQPASSGFGMSRHFYRDSCFILLLCLFTLLHFLQVAILFFVTTFHTCTHLQTTRTEPLGQPHVQIDTWFQSVMISSLYFFSSFFPSFRPPKPFVSVLSRVSHRSSSAPAELERRWATKDSGTHSLFTTAEGWGARTQGKRFEEKHYCVRT